MKVKFLLIALMFPVVLMANGLEKNKTETYKVNPNESKVEWDGKKVGGSHNGEIAIKEGYLETDGKSIKGGKFEIDMNSITCLDLTDEGTNQRLVGHLKSDDFFGTDNHPVSSLVITKAVHKGGYNYEITGDLTIKDITHEIVFPATVQWAKDKVTAVADMKVDRTNYDIKFRSGKFFDSLGDKLIYDDFTLKVKLVANQNAL